MNGLILIGFSLPASLIDIKSYRIPDALSLGGLAAALLGRLFYGNFIQGIFGALVGATLLAIVYAASRGRLGFGDVKLAAFHGAVLGIPGFFWGQLAASVGGLVFGLVMRKRWNPEKPIPFAPFLSGGALLAFIGMEGETTADFLHRLLTCGGLQ